MSRFRYLLSVLFVCLLVISSVFPGQQEVRATSKQIDDVEDYLKNVTGYDREKIREITGTTGIQSKILFPDLNIHSDQDVNIIVQFTDEPSMVEVVNKKAKGISTTLSKEREKVSKTHNKFKGFVQKNVAKAKSSEAKINRNYDLTFNGVSMTLPSKEVPKLLELEYVKAVWEDFEVKVEPVASPEVSNDSPALDSIKQIDADRLHEEGITGKGIKVGVLDTGIDFNHPDLQQVYKGGYDLIDDDNEPMETTYEDWLNSGQPERNPLSETTYYTSHGTHVAGSIAGNGANESEYAVTGVAPEVDLYGYRVLGPYGSGMTSIIIDGIEKAVEDGMDVINLSLGSSANHPFDPSAVAIDNAVKAGVVAVVASGNSGALGSFSIGSPATSTLGIAVGASSYSITRPTMDATYESGTAKDTFTQLPLLGKDYTTDLQSFLSSPTEIVYVHKGTKQDYQGKDVQGKVVLVARGDFALHDKVVFAKENGAKAVIMYNNNQEEGHIPFYLGEANAYIPSFSLTYEQGMIIKQLVEKEATKLSFHDVSSVKTDGDMLAGFSSKGPTRLTYDIKPEVVAPGVDVFSSVPAFTVDPSNPEDYTYSYRRASGTSMAAPHVAGAVALLLQAKPDLTPEQVKATLMNTAEKLNGDTSVWESGSGRINIYEAVQTDTSISVRQETKNHQGELLVENGGSLSFGSYYTSDKEMKYKLPITVSNNSNKVKKFSVSFIENHSNGSKKLDENGVKLTLPNNLTVPHKKSMTRDVTLEFSKDAEPGYYEGMVVLTNREDKTEQYHIPFGTVLMKQGIKELIVPYSSFTTRRDYNHGYMGYTPVLFSFNSPMVALDLVLKDRDTGKALGIIESYQGDIIEDTLFGMEFGFVGLYFPFTGDQDHPVEYAKQLAPPGNYEIEAISRAENGKVFSKSQPLFIENTLPELSMNTHGGVYEVDENGLTISGNVFDEHVGVLNQYGIETSQASNEVTLLNLTRYNAKNLEVAADGSFTTDLKLNEGANTTRFTLRTLDLAMNGMQEHPHSTYHLIKAGIPYVKLASENIDVKYGEGVSVKLSSQHIEKMQKANFELRFPQNIFTLEDVKISSELQQLLDNQGVEGTISTSTSTIGTNEVLAIQLELNSQIEDIHEKPLLELSFSVKENHTTYAKWIQNINISKATVHDENGSSDVLRFGQGFNILPTVSQLEGGILPEAFMSGVWLDYTKDMLSAGITATLTSKDGTVYEGTVNSAARYIFKGLPPTDEPYTLSVKLPGHFERVVEVSHLGDEFNGVDVGRMTYIFYAMTLAGDVNQDGVIDIIDALEMKKHYSSNERPADLDHDGTVGENDMRFVVRNYLEQNTMLKNTPEPKEEVDGVNLQSILEELGLTHLLEEEENGHHH